MRLEDQWTTFTALDFGTQGESSAVKEATLRARKL
jgi:hypothetical protein